jgi:hypothetical protein
MAKIAKLKDYDLERFQYAVDLIETVYENSHNSLEALKTSLQILALGKVTVEEMIDYLENEGEN